jgi:predicted dehydrogenase
MSQLRIALLGAGNHSRQNHVTSLARYRDEHPDEVELVALCDLREDHAKEVASEHGFAKVYTDLTEMLDAEKPDGCAAITPIPVTLEISTAIMRAGIPVVVEKPPGDTVEEARRICGVAAETGTPSMVSMNRRFDPALTAAKTWWGDRPLEYLRGTMIRHRRREDEFIKGTAIHALDAMRSVAGDIADWSLRMRTVDGIRWYFIDITFQSGTHGLLEVTPTAGSVAEWYEFYGPDCRAIAHVGDYGPGDVNCWEGNERKLHEASTEKTPLFVRNGTYNETAEFIAAIRDGRDPGPSPAQVLQSVEICHAIADEADRR